MLKVNIKDIQHFIRKFHFIVFLLLFLGSGIIIGTFIAGLLPGIFIFIFFLFEKHILKNDNMKKYNLLDISITSLFYGMVFMGIIFGLSILIFS